MEERKITVPEALEATIRLLGGICVPRSMNREIGIPIDTAIANLEACINAIKEAQDGTDHAE